MEYNFGKLNLAKSLENSILANTFVMLHSASKERSMTLPQHCTTIKKSTQIFHSLKLAFKDLRVPIKMKWQYSPVSYLGCSDIEFPKELLSKKTG